MIIQYILCVFLKATDTKHMVSPQCGNSGVYPDDLNTFMGFPLYRRYKELFLEGSQLDIIEFHKI